MKNYNQHSQFHQTHITSKTAPFMLLLFSLFPKTSKRCTSVEGQIEPVTEIPLAPGLCALRGRPRTRPLPPAPRPRGPGSRSKPCSLETDQSRCLSSACIPLLSSRFYWDYSTAPSEADSNRHTGRYCPAAGGPDGEAFGAVAVREGGTAFTSSVVKHRFLSESCFSRYEMFILLIINYLRELERILPVNFNTQ